MRFVFEIDLGHAKQFSTPCAANKIVAVLCENLAKGVMRVGDITELVDGKAYRVEFGPPRAEDGAREVHARAYVDDAAFDNTPQISTPAARGRLVDELGEVGRALLAEAGAPQ